jgi:hypothetical protein
MWDDPKFKQPFTCIISGPTGSGKTSFCIRFLQNFDRLCTEPDFGGDIMWYYSEKSAVPSNQLDLLGKRVRIHEGLPTTFGHPQGKPSLIILDDLFNQVYSEQVCDLFTKGSHHRQVSVILITQNLFYQGKHWRDISLNAKYLVLLKNFRDKTQSTYLARQVHPQNSASLYEAYLDATKEPHGYFISDFAQDIDNLLTFRTYVFPDEGPVVCYAQLDHETDKIQLPHSPNTQGSKTWNYGKPSYQIAIVN